jgi:hypothetical protein
MKLPPPEKNQNNINAIRSIENTSLLPFMESAKNLVRALEKEANVLKKIALVAKVLRAHSSKKVQR